MPSMPKPMGEAPKEKVDVKPVESSKPQEIEAKVENVSIEANDLKEIEEAQKVPYSRFKEKNDEAKRLKAELQAANDKYQEDLKKFYLEKEALKSVKPRDEGILEFKDPAEEALNSLKSELSQVKNELREVKGQTAEDRARAKLAELQMKYPEADQMAVLGWQKVQKGADLEELMELSHTRNLERLDKKLKDLIEKKKAKANVPIAQQIGYKIKESEKPKSVKEATALLMRLARE